MGLNYGWSKAVVPKSWLMTQNGQIKFKKLKIKSIELAEEGIFWKLKKGNWTFPIHKMGIITKNVCEPLVKRKKFRRRLSNAYGKNSPIIFSNIFFFWIKGRCTVAKPICFSS